MEKGSFDLRYVEIIDKKQDERIVESESKKKVIISNSMKDSTNMQNQYEEFSVEFKNKNYVNYADNKKDIKKIHFRSKFFDFFKNNSIKYLLIKIKHFYSKFIISIFDRLNNLDRIHLSYLFNEKQIESIKLLDFDYSHPLNLIEQDQIKHLKRIHYRVDNSSSFSFLEKAIKTINDFNNNLHTLIIETNQFSKLKEIFSDFGKNFHSLINLHIYLLDKPLITFEEIIKNLSNKLDYIKNNKQKYVSGNMIKIPFKNLTFRNFTNKAKIDIKILLDFFRKMMPSEYGVDTFSECFECLNLSGSIIDDQTNDLAKIVNGFRIIKRLNISHITYAIN